MLDQADLVASDGVEEVLIGIADGLEALRRELRDAETARDEAEAELDALHADPLGDERLHWVRLAVAHLDALAEAQCRAAVEAARSEAEARVAAARAAADEILVQAHVERARRLVDPAGAASVDWHGPPPAGEPLQLRSAPGLVSPPPAAASAPACVPESDDASRFADFWDAASAATAMPLVARVAKVSERITGEVVGLVVALVLVVIARVVLV